MIVAHLSDLHLASTAPIAPRRLVGKRFTGWVNLRLHRAHKHQREHAVAVAREIRKLRPDHVVITGDVSNLALEDELDGARALLRAELGFDAAHLSMVPGNHDTYTRGAYRQRRFERYFGEHLGGDLPGASSVVGLDRYPYVRLRGPLAIIGLSTALPRPPLVASGSLGAPQRHALRSLLHHDLVRRRTVMLLQHHPWHRHAGAVKQALEGLLDAEQERETFAHLERGLLLHGHLHRRLRRTIATGRGQLDAFGAGSASLADPARGGFSLYEMDAQGHLVRAAGWHPTPGGGLREVALAAPGDTPRPGTRT